MSTNSCYKQRERNEKSFYNCHVCFEFYKLVFILFTLAQRLDSHVFPSFFIASHLCTACCWCHVNINFLLVQCNFFAKSWYESFHTSSKINKSNSFIEKSKNYAMFLKEQPQNNYLVTFRESSIILNYITN